MYRRAAGMYPRYNSSGSSNGTGVISSGVRSDGAGLTVGVGLSNDCGGTECRLPDGKAGVGHRLALALAGVFALETNGTGDFLFLRGAERTDTSSSGKNLFSFAFGFSLGSRFIKLFTFFIKLYL